MWVVIESVLMKPKQLAQRYIVLRLTNVPQDIIQDLRWIGIIWRQPRF